MAATPLSDLLQEVGVSIEQLDKNVSDNHLCSISVFLTSWETVATSLGLNVADVQAIEADGRGAEDKRMKMLQRWKNKFAFRATYRKFVKALLRLEMADLALKVCRLLIQPEPTANGEFTSPTHF